MKASKLAAFFTAMAICLTLMPINALAQSGDALPQILEIDFSENMMEYSVEQPNDNSVAQYSVGAAKSRTVIPESYNAMQEGVVTPAKDQGDSAACWAFSAISCAESSLIIGGYENSSVNLSEAALTWFSQNTAIGSDEGEMSDDAFANGGNWIMAALAMSRMSGLEYEDYEPFLGESTQSMSISDYQRDVCEYQLKCARNIESTDTAAIKTAVMENGGVSVSYYDDDEYYSLDEQSYYNPTAASINHSVTIIGWDDSYSKENFKSDNPPQSDGAWLVKGSWGDFSGDGCYYISYEEPELKYFCTFEMTDNSAADNVYTYTDSTSMVLAYSSGAIKGANVFTAERSETLSEVSFFIINTAGGSVGYDITVYKNPSSDNPTSSNVIAAAQGTVSCDGYYRAALDSQPTLSEGDTYSVVLTLEYPGSYSYMLCEGGTNAQSQSGESYISNGSAWYDCSSVGYNNIYINAYTSNTASVSADKAELSQLVSNYSQTAGVEKEIINARKTLADSDATVCDIRNAQLLLKAAAENSGDVITISSVQEFNSFAESVNSGETYNGKILLLESDIDFTDEDFICVGNAENSFQGCFDGNGHILSGINCTSSDTAAVFANADAYAVIKNLTVESSVFTGKNAGAIVGTFSGAAIVGCGFEGTASASGYSGAAAAKLESGYVDSLYTALSEQSDANAFFGECGSQRLSNLFAANGSQDDSCEFTVFESAGECAYLLNTAGAAQVNSGKWTFDDFTAVKTAIGDEPAHKIICTLLSEDYVRYSDCNGLIEFPQTQLEDGYVLVWYNGSQQIPQDYAFTQDTQLTASIQMGVSISGAAVSGVTSQTYSGTAKTQPSLTVSYNNTTLTKGVDYTVSYSNNVSAGTAYLYINGIGGFYGTKTVSFTINPLSVTNAVISSIPSTPYTGDEICPTVTVKIGSTTVSSSDYTVSYENNVNAGRATAVVTFKGNYTGTCSKTFYITGRSIENVDFSWDTMFVYTGSEILTSITAKDGSKLLTQGEDYKVNYYNNVEAGLAKALITMRGNYNGMKVVYYTIYPQKVQLNSVQVGSAGSFTANWNTLASGTGYQIQYSQSPDFKSSAYKTVADLDKSSQTVSGLKKGTVYYVRVRGYTQITDRIKAFGEYSQVIKVTVN